jgi:hypothetical protein
LDNKEAESAVKKKTSSKRRKAKKSDGGDLFGDDDDLPGKYNFHQFISLDSRYVRTLIISSHFIY